MKDTRGLVEGAERERLAKGFGTALRTVRNEQEISLQHLGQLAGVSRTHISHLERGYRRPSDHIISALVSVLAPEPEREALCARLAALAGDSLREVAPRKKRREGSIARHRARIEYATKIAAKQRAVRRIESQGGVTFPEQRRMTRTELTERLAHHAKSLPARSSSSSRRLSRSEQKLELLTGLENLSLVQIAKRLDKIKAIDLQDP